MFTIKKDKIKYIAWGGLALILMVYFVCIYYPDICVTSRFSLIFLDCLKNGEIFQFYDVSLQNLDISLGVGATYFIPIYVIFAVWNLPIWIITRFGGIAEDCIGCILWEKGIVVIFSIGCIWMLCRIFQKLKCADLEYSSFLFASSLLFVCPSMAMIQYDVIELFFILCGIYYFLEDERLFWRSMLFFSIGISIKLFALFILLLLVLVTEKRILYIIFDMVCSIWFTVITMIPFWGNGYQECAAEYNNSFFGRLFTVTFPSGIASGISIFCLGFVSLCVIAYLQDVKSAKENVQFLAWLSAACFLWLFAFVLCHPQWAVLMLPFWIFVSMEHKNNFKINMILEIILEGTLILIEAVHFDWVYFTDSSLSHLVLKNTGLQLDKGAHNLYEVVSFFNLQVCIPGIYAAFLVCGIVLLVLNNPWKPFIQQISHEELVCAGKVVRVIRVGLVILYFVTTCVIAF